MTARTMVAVATALVLGRMVTQATIQEGARSRYTTERAARQRSFPAFAEAERQYAAQYYSNRYGIDLQLSQLIYESAIAEGLDPDLGFRLVRVESVFHPEARSHAGALGLTQLMPGTVRWLDPSIQTEKQIFDEKTNLRLGFRFLKMLIKDFNGDIRLALVAYNRGPGIVNREISAGRSPYNGYGLLVLGERGSGHARNVYNGPGYLAD